MQYKGREDWMLEGEWTFDRAAKELSQKRVAEWINDIYINISSEKGQKLESLNGFKNWFNLLILMLFIGFWSNLANIIHEWSSNDIYLL